MENKVIFAILTDIEYSKYRKAELAEAPELNLSVSVHKPLSLSSETVNTKETIQHARNRLHAANNIN